MERILGILCVLSAIIVPGLLTKQEDLETVEKTLEELLVERFVKNTLRELYEEDNDELKNAKRNDEMSTQSTRAYSHAKRFDDLHARGTNLTSTPTNTPPPPPLPTNKDTATVATQATTKAPIFNFCKRWWWSWRPCKKSMEKRVSSFDKFSLLQRMLEEELE